MIKKEKIKEAIKLLKECLEENKTYEVGEGITFKSLEWLVTKDNNTTIAMILKNVLDEERIKKYVTDEELRNGFEVVMTDTIKSISWEQSFIYNVVLPKFKEDLGINCEVTLPSKEEIEELSLEIRECDHYYWTRTPRKNGETVESSASFAGVSGGGSYDVWVASYSGGVRPLLIIDKELLEEE